MNDKADNTIVKSNGLVDPLTFLFTLPILPALIFMQYHLNMINQLSQMSNSQSQKTKVTSITRNGNTLDIIEKWV